MDGNGVGFGPHDGDESSDIKGLLHEAGVIFGDAHAMYAAALNRLEAEDLRDAAEKAWCATLRATVGLIVARTGETPRKSPSATRMLRRLPTSDPNIEPLVKRYFTAQGALHGDCFYLGLCEPADDTGRRIRDTIDYINEAKRLALL